MISLAVTECSMLLFFNYWGLSCEQPPLTTFNQPGFDTEWWSSVEFHSRVLATPRRQILSRALDYMCRQNSIWIGNNNAIRKLCDPGRLTMATFGPVDIETPLKNTLTCFVCLPAMYINVSQENPVIFVFFFWPYKCLQCVLMCQSGNDMNETKWPPPLSC